VVQASSVAGFGAFGLAVSAERAKAGELVVRVESGGVECGVGQRNRPCPSTLEPAMSVGGEHGASVSPETWSYHDLWCVVRRKADCSPTAVEAQQVWRFYSSTGNTSLKKTPGGGPRLVMLGSPHPRFLLHGRCHRSGLWRGGPTSVRERLWVESRPLRLAVTELL